MSYPEDGGAGSRAGDEIVKKPRNEELQGCTTAPELGRQSRGNSLGKPGVGHLEKQKPRWA